MEVRLNGRVYTCLEQLREQADEELFLFLEEWFDDRSYVLGHTSGSTGAPKEIQFCIGNRYVLSLVVDICLSASFPRLPA